MITRIDVTIGEINKNVIVDIYEVGKKPTIVSGKKPHSEKIVKEIEIIKSERFIEAIVYFEDEIFWTSKVTDYYESQPYTTLRTTRDIPEH